LTDIFKAAFWTVENETKPLY